MNTFSVDKATTIRQPSTANLMIDSADRNTAIYSTPWDFQIVKSQNTQTGFFTRVGATEVVFSWCSPNITSNLGNNEIEFDISGTGANTFNGSVLVQGIDGIYTVEQLLDTIASLATSDLVAQGAPGISMSVASLVSGDTVLELNGGVFKILASPLQEQLDLTVSNNYATNWSVGRCADLRPYKYIDIVSPDLTYAQDLKDNSTQSVNRDVLVRWYFADDVPEPLDAYGFPILMGYNQFCRRRIYNPPKQIKWDNNLPLGNIRFSLYDENGDLITLPAPKTNWLMTLQLSEN